MIHKHLSSSIKAVHQSRPHEKRNELMPLSLGANKLKLSNLQTCQGKSTMNHCCEKGKFFSCFCFSMFGKNAYVTWFGFPNIIVFSITLILISNTITFCTALFIIKLLLCCRYCCCCFKAYRVHKQVSTWWAKTDDGQRFFIAKGCRKRSETLNWKWAPINALPTHITSTVFCHYCFSPNY